MPTARMQAVEAIVLDAMGVMYRVGDDVAELLVPHVTALGGADARTVQEAYLRASRGELTAAQLWTAVGLSEPDEDGYLAGHQLAPDLVAFLEWATAAGYAVACLSNDVAEWSLKLRRRFGLERWVSEWVISGDVRARKPEPEIYAALIRRMWRPPASMLFVDDRERNLDAAAHAGLRTTLLSARLVESRHPRVASLTALRAVLAGGPAPHEPTAGAG